MSEIVDKKVFVEEDTEEDELTIQNHQYPADQDFSVPLNSKPIVSFGLITDIQYAEHDNAFNYLGDKMRYYRNSINLVKEAVKHWREKIDENKNFKFILQLGDIIDGKASADRENALESVLNELNSDFRTQIPDFRVYHIWGNHEFYNFKRSEIVNTELNSAKHMNPTVSTSANYYKLDLTNDIEIICLDFYEFSALGFDEDDDVYKEAMSLLRKHNPNEDLNSADGLRGHGKRFTKFNGALSKQQMTWLADQLQILKEKNKKAIIVGHIPVHPQATTTPMCLAWNYRDVLEIFNKYAKTILAYLCGHDHDGGYFRDKSNIHHLTVPAIIETPPNTNSFATIKVFDNKISIEGVGLIGYYEIYY